MAEDSYWYEAAFVIGITNALNVVADGLILPDGTPLLSPAADGDLSAEVFADIREFSGAAATPPAFRILAADPAYLAAFWQAWKRAFSDNRLGRKLKESLAFATSLTCRSTFGTRFHLEQMRRLGVGERGVLEIVGVTQMFSSYTKIADTLQLEPDMGHIAPSDPSPSPSGSQ